MKFPSRIDLLKKIPAIFLLSTEIRRKTNARDHWDFLHGCKQGDFIGCKLGVFGYVVQINCLEM